MTKPKAASDGPVGRRYPLLFDGEVVKLPSANTVLGALDKPGLSVWKQKIVAFGVATNPDRYELAQSWDTCYEAVRACLDEASYEADLGTAVHEVTAAIDTGDPTPWEELIPATIKPDEVEPYAEQWARCKAEHRLTLVAVEQTVYNRRYGFAGTLDRAAVVPALGIEAAVIGDIKTGASVWPDTALQLVAYAHHEGTWNVERGAGPALPVSPDIGVVFHLGPDFYEVVPMDLTEAWGAFLSAAACWKWSAEDSRRAIGPALKPPPPEDEQWPW